MSQMKDPRGIEGMLTRGRNVYAGGLPSAPGAGRPMGTTGVPSPGSGPQAGQVGNQTLGGQGQTSLAPMHPPIKGQLGAQGYDQATIRLQLGSMLNGPRLG